MKTWKEHDMGMHNSNDLLLHYFFSFLEYCVRTLAGEVRILKRRACCCAEEAAAASYPRLTSNPISVPRVLLIARCKLFYFYQCALRNKYLNLKVSGTSKHK